jgi:CRISPR-associated protein Cas2
MYVIMVYDVNKKRVGKMCKIIREYLNWIQNSVFEGEISEGKLVELKSKLKKVMKLEEDSLIIFNVETDKWLKREIIGKEFNPRDNIL